MTKKLYRVEINHTAVVYCDEYSINFHAREAVNDDELDNVYHVEITEPDMVPTDYYYAIPWGEKSNRTVEQILEAEKRESFIKDLKKDLKLQINDVILSKIVDYVQNKTTK